ncbi:MAG: hypothetical protein RIC80_14020 [Cyclobacteriaceae bacterium]
MRKLRVLIAMMMIAGIATLTSCEETEMDELAPMLDIPEAQMTNGNAGTDQNRPPRPGSN